MIWDQSTIIKKLEKKKIFVLLLFTLEIKNWERLRFVHAERLSICQFIKI